jgi:hypothetical protein
MVRLAGAEPVDFAIVTTGCDFFRILAQRAFCASAILRREAADMIRFGRPDLVDTRDDPFKDSIPEITWSNLSRYQNPMASSQDALATVLRRTLVFATILAAVLVGSGLLVFPRTLWPSVRDEQIH